MIQTTVAFIRSTHRLAQAGLVTSVTGIALLSSTGCDLGTYNQRMNENIKPLSKDAETDANADQDNADAEN